MSGVLKGSHSTSGLLSPPSRVIAYSNAERTSKAPSRHPYSTFDKFNQSFIRGETDHSREGAESSPMPALPKVHRDMSAKEFYYGPAGRDPVKQAKSMFNLAATDAKNRTILDRTQGTSKLPRERDLKHAAKQSEQKVGQV